MMQPMIFPNLVGSSHPFCHRKSTSLIEKFSGLKFDDVTRFLCSSQGFVRATSTSSGTESAFREWYLFALCCDVQLTDLGGTFCTFYSRMIEHPTKHGAVVGCTPPE